MIDGLVIVRDENIDTQRLSINLTGKKTTSQMGCYIFHTFVFATTLVKTKRHTLLY